MQTIIAGPVKEDARYSVANLWTSSARVCTSQKKPVWVEGVQKYYDDIMVAFSTFPGPLKEQADLLKIPFQEYLTKLVNYSNSNTTVLSSGSTKILGALSKVKLQANTADGVIKEFYRVLPSLTKTYSEIVSNLSTIIGKQSSCSVNRAMSDLKYAYTKYMKEFLQEDDDGFKKEVDFEPITKSAEKLKKSIALIDENNTCSDPDVNNASTILNLILGHLMICYHGLDGCSQAILYEQKCH